MERFSAPHTGANQAEIIWKLLEQYGLRHTVDYITTDNATNNDTAIYELAKLFSNINVAFDPVSVRMHCFGHVINIVVKAFLRSQNADAVVQELGAFDDDVDTTQKLQLSRKRGRLGHLHNICTSIFRSPEWRDRFTGNTK